MTEPAFAPATLEALRSLSLDATEDVLPRILTMFQSTLDKAVRDIEAAITASDWRTLKVAAHSLKGACYNVGATRLSECCRHLETVGALAAQQQVVARYGEFTDELHRAQAELRLLLVIPAD